MTFYIQERNRDTYVWERPGCITPFETALDALEYRDKHVAAGPQDTLLQRKMRIVDEDGNIIEYRE